MWEEVGCWVDCVGGELLGGLCGRKWGAGLTVWEEVGCWVDCGGGDEVLGGLCVGR